MKVADVAIGIIHQTLAACKDKKNAQNFIKHLRQTKAGKQALSRMKRKGSLQAYRLGELVAMQHSLDALSQAQQAQQKETEKA